MKDRGPLGGDLPSGEAILIEGQRRREREAKRWEREGASFETSFDQRARVLHKFSLIEFEAIGISLQVYSYRILSEKRCSSNLYSKFARQEVRYSNVKRVRLSVGQNPEEKKNGTWRGISKSSLMM